MKRIILIFILCHFYSSIYSENYWGFKLGITHPLTIFNTSRSYGGELGFNYGVKIYNTFFFETGCMMDISWRRNNPIINYSKYYWGSLKGDSIPEHYIENGSYFKFAAYAPILINYKFLDNRIETKMGLLLSVRRLLLFTKYTGYDPENTGNTDRRYFETRFGIDINFGVSFQLNKEYGIYTNYHIPLNVDKFKYGIVSIGLTYNIVCR